MRRDEPRKPETEVKLRLPDGRRFDWIVDFLRGQRCAVTALPPRRQEDVYLDTFEWTLFRKNRSLRLRCMGDRVCYTLKAVSPIENGLAQREETEIEIRKPVPDPAKIPDRRLRERIDGWIHPRALLQQLVVRTERRPFRLARNGTEIELSFDVSSFRAAGLNRPVRAARLFEMEAELVRGDRGGLIELSDSLRSEFRLEPSPESKLQTAMRRLRIAVPSKTPPYDLTIAHTDRFDVAVRKILYFQHRRLTAYRDRIPLDIDTEFVHQTRVAARRMRSALKLFSDALPMRQVRFLSEELKWLGSELGSVRDLDVFLLKLPRITEKIEQAPRRSVGEFRQWLLGRRGDVLNVLARTIASARVRRLDCRIESWMNPSLPAPSRPTAPRALRLVEEIAPPLLRRRFEAVLDKGRAVLKRPKPKDFHRLRIAGKKLRYACEFLDPAFGGRLKPLIRVVTKIQDCLGDFQDTIFTRDLLDRIRREWHGKAVTPELWFLLGEIHQYQAEIARFQAAAFADLWGEFDRDDVRAELDAAVGNAAL